MDIANLKLFVAAAEVLNISAAGRQLGFTPAVASARLGKLEREVGADLLHRSTRRVSLSSEGAAYLPYAREIIAQHEAGLAALGRGSESLTGTLRFAASSTFAQLFIAPLLPAFLAQHPGLNVELKLTDLPMPLIEGGFDLALRNSAIEDSSLHGRKLADDTRVLCASPDYLSTHGVPVKPRDLSAHQLIAFMDANPRRLTSTTGRPACHFPPSKSSPRVVLDDGASMRALALAGVGICMSSVWNVARELRDGSLIRVLPDYQVDDESAIWLVYPRSNVLTSKVRAFIDFLVAYLPEEVLNGSKVSAPQD
ncbi:MAG: LysR substrate-binding domain-containing protein [Pseudomonadota bacterium]